MPKNVRLWVALGAATASVGVATWLVMDRWVNSDAAPAKPGAAIHPAAVPVASSQQPPPAVGVPPADVSVATTAVTDRVKLVGILTLGSDRVAMIVVDGQPARMLRPGEAVVGDWILREVLVQSAVITPRDGGAAITLQLESPSPAAKAEPVRHPNSAPFPKLSDGSAESKAKLRQMGARNAPIKAPPAAEQTSAPQPSVPADPGRWRPPGQP